MELFSGEFHHQVDSKSRLIVPSEFRDILGSSFKIGVSYDPCLTLYTKEGFEQFYAKLQALPQFDPDARQLIRYFIGGTRNVEVDRQGRILLPQQLKDRVQITKSVVYVGVGTSAELWAEEVYDGIAQGQDSRAASEAAQRLLAKGFAI